MCSMCYRLAAPMYMPCDVTRPAATYTEEEESDGASKAPAMHESRRGEQVSLFHTPMAQSQNTLRFAL